MLIAASAPVGLALAVELGLRGVGCLVVEPRAQLTRLRPRANTLNARTREHRLRRWGLAETVRRRSAAACLLVAVMSPSVRAFLGETLTRFTRVPGLRGRSAIRRSAGR